MFKEENIAVLNEELGNLSREKEAIKKESDGSSRTEKRQAIKTDARRNRKSE